VHQNVPEENVKMIQNASPCLAMTALPRPFAVEVGGGLATFKAQGH